VTRHPTSHWWLGPTPSWRVGAWTESKHPRDPQGKFDDGAPGTTIATGVTGDMTSLESDEAKHAVQTALDAIGKLIKLKDPIAFGKLDNEDSATARMRATVGEVAIHEDNKTATITNSVAHEIGHYLDARIMGTGPDEWFTMTPAFNDLRASMWNSPTIKRVRNDEEPLLKGDTQMRNYFINGREMFARAFHQHVARISGDPVLNAEIDKIQNESMLSFQVWQDDEFKPIAAKLDQLLAEHGIKQ
jgi:hypothetical protein